MNDIELNLNAIQTEASRQRAEAFMRLVLAIGRIVARPFRRDAGQAA